MPALASRHALSLWKATAIFKGQTFGESSLVASVANWVQAGSARLTFYLETLVKLVSRQDKRILLFTVSRIYTSMPVLELKSSTKMKTANSISKIRRQTNCQFWVPETKELIHSLQKGCSCWTNHGLALFLHLLHIGKGVEHECTEQENAAKVGWLGLNTPNIPLAFQELNGAKSGKEHFSSKNSRSTISRLPTVTFSCSSLSLTYWN